MQQHNILYSYSTNLEKDQGWLVPQHILWLLVSGTMDVITPTGVKVYGKNTLCLVRKNQLLKVIKKPEGEKPFRGIGILLDQNFLENYATKHNLKAGDGYVGEPNIMLPLDPFLTGYFDSLKPYFDLPGHLTETLAKSKTTEAIELLLRNPALQTLLFDFNESFKIDLESYMNRHFTSNISLAQFAELTGRSLSTFKRDFKKVFATTPEKWLKQQRLEQAHFLIGQQRRRPSEVYWEVGFENLSHFSESFKAHFGYSPALVGKQPAL